MNNKKSLLLIYSMTLVVSCSKQSNNNDNAVITDINATSIGITTLDDKFTVNTTSPNAKSGDVMKVELLKSAGGTSTQLVPLTGTQQTVTLASDLTTSVTYTREEAQLNNAGDSVYVSFAGKTKSTSIVIQMVHATSVSTPQAFGMSVNVTRGAGTAWFVLAVQPKSGDYTGNVIVKKKNLMNNPWINVGNFAVMDTVPISGDDFAVNKDTMYYSFISQMGTHTDTVNMTILDHDPYFFLKKSGTMTLGGSSAGLNLLINAAVQATDVNAIIAIDEGFFTIHGGPAWAVGGKSISFVPYSKAMYDQNYASSAMATFMFGTPITIANPLYGESVYIFKIVKGSNPSDVFYGMLKITNIVPGVSISYEYRIGNTYNQLQFIK